MRLTLRLITIAGFALLLQRPAPADPLDADFLAARAAFNRGDGLSVDAFAAPFAGQLLEPYVAYWQLKLRLDAASRDDVRAYLERWPEGPLSDRLRVEWLKTLGARRDWESFALDYPPPTGEDTDLTCFAIQFRWQRTGAEALDAAKPLWFTGNATPDSCDPLFAALIDKGALNVSDRRARVRLAVEAGNLRFAQALAAELPPDARITAKEFAAVERDPARALAKGHFQWKSAAGRDLALYTLERAARSDAPGVRAAWEAQRAHLPEADRRYGNARIAYHAARQLSPKANDWFREAHDAPLDENAHAWHVRAALRAGSWPDVLKAVDAMSALQAKESAWRYWRARALANAGKRDEANAIYASLAQEFNFYGLLAGEALGRVPVAGGTIVATDIVKPTAEQVARFGARAGVQRAVKLARLDMRPESIKEWNHAVRGFDDSGLLVAAEYARRNGFYDRAINIADRTVAQHDFSLRYLMPYSDQFTNAAREQAIDPAILLGVARQESRFNVDIVSSAGAMGLMQLMPQTARWVAKQLGRADYVPEQIGDVAINTQFGAYYFKYWLERLERLPALATAAYNAGPGRAQAWRVGTPLEGAIWVETIPFNETRDYVKKVLANTMFYARRLDQPYVSLSARLGTIPPRTTVLAGGGLISAQAN